MIAQWTDGGRDVMIPERQLHGTLEEKVEQLDETIEALVGLRAWLVSSLATPAPTRRAERLANLAQHLVRFSVLAAAVALPGIAAAQDTAPKAQEPPSAAAPSPVSALDGVKFGVAFEGFYQYNWNEPYDRINLLRAYDTRANVFGIQQAAIVVDGRARRRRRPPLRRPRRPPVRPGHRDGAGRRRQRAAPRRLPPRLAGLRHLRLPGRPRPAGRLRQVRLEPRLRDQLRQGQQQLLARLPVQLPAVLPLGPARQPAAERRDDGDVHAHQRHPADRGLQRLQEQPLHGRHQARRQHRLDDQLLLRPGAARRRRTRGARRVLQGVRHLRRLHRRPPRSASASTSTT